MNNTEDLKRVQEKRLRILEGDASRVAKQRARNKLTARERIDRLLDPNSFVETDVLVSRQDDYAGVVTGYGTVNSRPVYVFAQDFTVHGGAMGVQQASKILKILDLAQKTGAPVLCLCDSAGVRLDEGAEAMSAYAKIYTAMAKLSGVCPMIALILGPAVGGAALISQLCDFSIMAENCGELMVYGPQVMSAISGKPVDEKNGGGAAVMAAQGGVSLTAADDAAALALARQLLAYLPGCNLEDADVIDSDDLNREIGDTDPSDAAALMAEIADEGSYIELQSGYGKALRTALARIGGNAVGLVVSDAAEEEGMLTAEAAAKAARFVRFCDAYSLPVVSLVNSKGVAVPSVGRQTWLMKSVAQLLFAYAEATTAKISVVTGNAIGQSYVALAGKANADIAYAWPGAVISALTPEAAVPVLYQEELKADTASPLETRQKLENAFARDVADGIAAAQAGMVDDVIDPAQTRKYIIAALEMLLSKRDSNPPKKHGNLPL